MIQRRPIKPSVALAKLQELCARSEQCSYEILTRLKKWGVPDTTSAKILALLKRDRYVDDSRYVEAFVRDKVVFNRWGRTKIRLALVQKHLLSDLIADGLESIDNDEYVTALTEVLESKSRTLQDVSTYDARMKLLKYAVSRGFEMGIASEMIKKLFPR
ncbi:MAG: RecX family transcriptional regulator [Bacteroides sp.]|nr:RecX family transcriptional regulator [Bacteroides sp.]